jgi:hypothetical protein
MELAKDGVAVGPGLLVGGSVVWAYAAGTVVAAITTRIAATVVAERSRRGEVGCIVTANI